MKKSAFSLCLFFLLALSVRAQDPTAWRTTSWGMSAEQIRAALPGEQFVAVDPPEKFPDGLAPLKIPGYKVGGSAFDVSFILGDQGLAAVNMTVAEIPAAPLAFSELEKLFVSKYGQPGHVVSEGSLLQDVWTLPSSTIELSFARSFGVLVVNYKRRAVEAEDRI